MKFGEEYGIFDSINETYCWLLRTHVEDQRGRDSIQWMQPYLSTLRKYAKRCSHITEFGINQCVSTWAFLAARPNKMVSVDIDLNRRATQYIRAFDRVNYWLISAIILSQREGSTIVAAYDWDEEYRGFGRIYVVGFVEDVRPWELGLPNIRGTRPKRN